MLPVAATAGEAPETAAVKAACTRSSARSETVRYPSMVVTAEGAGVRPVHSTPGNRARMKASGPAKSTRMQTASTNTVSEAALMTKPAGSTVAPESRTARNVR